MDVELRADGLHIAGYVNAVLRESKPVINKQNCQKVNEIIDEHVFERALEKSDNIPLTLDHDKTRVLAQTNDNTLRLYEDSIGLRADCVIIDEEVIAHANDLRGWSFGMKNVQAIIEERADKLPLRKIESLDLDHVTLVLNKMPCYSACSIELRAEDEEIDAIELRASDTVINFKETKQEVTKNEYDNTSFKTRIETLKSAK